MNAEELRELADALSIPTAYTYGQTEPQRKAIAAYLRACADAMEAGPVAWRYWNEKSRSWNETSSASVAAAMQEGGRSVEPLYPVALPTQPVSVADELPPDRIEAIAHRMATFYRHDEARGHEYMFKRRELLYFAARLLAEAQSSSNACQLQSFGNSEQLAIPQGWRLVPVEPTENMMAWLDVLKAGKNPSLCYRAMLASAPTPPVAAQSLRLPEPMTEEEIDAVQWMPSYENPMTLSEGLQLFARAIEAETLRRVKETNNG